MSHSLRLEKAFTRSGIRLSRDGSVIVAHRPGDGSTVRILLPPTLPLEEKAVRQLLDLAAVHRPDSSGCVLKACATPDFHPGTAIPVGSIVATSPDFVIPAAVGTDIGCGMRLLDTGHTLSEVESKKDLIVDALTRVLLENGRDIPMRPSTFAALFDEGPSACLDAVPDTGLWSRVDIDRAKTELNACVGLNKLEGAIRHAPEALVGNARDLIRDPALGTPGAGNHFVELQTVDSILDRHEAWKLGLTPGRVMAMIHTGSRDVGFFVGGHWRDKARASWPKGIPHPRNGLYALTGKNAAEYLLAMGGAGRYAWLNRTVLTEMIRATFRDIFGNDASRLIVDVPHNVITAENGLLIHRKGATPAHSGDLALIPGSMGDFSFIVSGLGNPDWLWSCSHGAGRALRRQAARASTYEKTEQRLSWNCITLRKDRLREENPNAYKDVRPVLEAQEAAGLMKPVAALRPWITFKA